MGLQESVMLSAVNEESFNPKISKSKHYKHWISKPDDRRCFTCKENHGKIFYIKEEPEPKPPVHLFCRCKIVVMNSIKSGTATKSGFDGADWWIKHNHKLPDYYISYKDALNNKWQPGKWPSNFFKNKMITKGIYYNDDGRLPYAPGRIWYEADINYKSGRRNNQRILWSNDGLVFVTYDHYHTFYEII